MGNPAECPQCHAGLVVPAVFVEEDEAPPATPSRSAAGWMTVRNIAGVVVLVVLVGVAGYVFYDKFGRKDDDAAGNTRAGENPEQPADTTRLGKIRRLMEGIEQAFNTTRSALSQPLTPESAPRVGGQLRDSATRIRRLTDELKAVGPITPDEEKEVIIPGRDVIEPLRIALKQAGAGLPPEAREAFSADLRVFTEALEGLKTAMRAAVPGGLPEAPDEQTKPGKVWRILEQYAQSRLAAVNHLIDASGGDPQIMMNAAVGLRGSADQVRLLAEELNAVGRLSPEEAQRAVPPTDPQVKTAYLEATAKVTDLIANGSVPAEAAAAIRAAMVEWEQAGVAFTRALRATFPPEKK
jgi:hypothetical protein